VKICLDCGQKAMTPKPHRPALCYVCTQKRSKARYAEREHYQGAWRTTSQKARAAGVCARCGAEGRPLEAHHVEARSLRKGVVPLCEPCHRAVELGIRRTGASIEVQ
jgi:hypothetical protein